jgi:hypothetical protein
MSSESSGDLNLLTRNLAHFHQQNIELLAGIRGASQLDAMFRIPAARTIRGSEARSLDVVPRAVV